LAAINRNLDVRALIDPITQLRLAQAERLLRETPSLGGVFPFFQSEPEVIFMPQPAPQPIIIVTPGAAQQAAASTEAPTASEPSADARPSEQVRDVGNFVLALRDGRQISAAAVMRQGDRVVYVTPDGVRHSLPINELDLTTTATANEERGTSLQL